MKLSKFRPFQSFRFEQHGSEDAVSYRQQCRDQGWEMAASVGRWLCWSRPVSVGHAALPLRDAQRTLALCRKNEYLHWLTAAGVGVACTLHVPVAPPFDLPQYANSSEFTY